MSVMAVSRSGSCSSLFLLDSELDNNSDVFDPPPWKAGRFLQFADISLEDEPTVRPVSLSADRKLSVSSSVSYGNLFDVGVHVTSSDCDDIGDDASRTLFNTSCYSDVESDVRLTSQRTGDCDVVDDDFTLQPVMSKRIVSDVVDPVWSAASSRSSYVVQMDSNGFVPRHLGLSRRSTFIVTSCLTVALTALTFLTFAF